jgi:hypothetical protein
MGAEPRTERQLVTRQANIVLACAGALAFASLFLTPRWALLAAFVVGSGVSLVLARFALSYRKRARGGLSNGNPASGRIVESRDAGRVSFDMPASGTEPWLADAWILLVATTVVVVMAVVAGMRPLFAVGFIVILTIGLGLRLANAPSDRLHIHIGQGLWTVEALAFGRPVRRTGRGAILPELVDDALVLWSRDGRIGVLRGELEPEERGWLAARLTSFVAESDLASVEVEARPQREGGNDAVGIESAVEAGRRIGE